MVIERRREAIIGLTPEERDNIQIMEGLKEKYPDAFEVVVDDNGREVMILKGNTGPYSDREIVLTQYGHVFLGLYYLRDYITIRDIDLTRFVDLIRKSEVKILPSDEWENTSYRWLKKEGAPETKKDRVPFRRIDLGDVSVRKELKKSLKSAQKIARKEAERAAKKTAGVERVLAEL